MSLFDDMLAALMKATTERRPALRWEMTIAAFNNLQRDRGLQPKPHLLVGAAVDPFLDLPVVIIPGGPVIWRLIVEAPITG